MAACFGTKSVKVLQRYLKDRGVIFGDQRKPALVELCELAAEVGIEIDPDRLVEDRQDVINRKLCFVDVCLTSPNKLSGISNISCVPVLSIFDIYNYLLGFSDYNHSTLRSYHQMEGYTMFKDGYVTNIQAVPYTNTEYVAVKACVKPRTNDRDPVTKLSHYSCWIVLRSSSESSIQSAYCTCKGGETV